MQKKVKLITGASGEIGQALIKQFSNDYVITLDLAPLDVDYKKHTHFIGSILDTNLLNKLNTNYQIIEIYHLAAVLSTKAEKYPQLAKEVNIKGTNNMYELCLSQIKKYNHTVSFFFPSSIAVYNISLENQVKIIDENKFTDIPVTVYGKSKLVCEQAGEEHAKVNNFFDYRCIRFPGIISSETMPTGGTSDYASEIIHSAISGDNYSCFVDSKTILPFIVMPDAISAIIKLMASPQKYLTINRYNITSFSPSVIDLKNKIQEFFPNFHLDYHVNSKRQKIVNSWPSYINDLLAKNDWGWGPKYNFDNAFKNYIIPNLFTKYHSEKKL